MIPITGRFSVPPPGRAGGAALSLVLGLVLGGCLGGKGESPAGPGPDTPGSAEKLSGWYRVETGLGSGTGAARKEYIGLLAGGNYHALSYSYSLRPSGDSVLRQVAWGRGLWIHSEDSLLSLARYRYGYVYDTGGVAADWQAAIRFEDTAISARNYVLTRNASGFLLAESPGGGGKMRLVPSALPEAPAFDPGQGPAFSLAASDQDKDGTPDATDPDIDGDRVGNALDCHPFAAYLFVPGPSGDCTSLSAPSYFTAQSGDGMVTLTWSVPYPGTISVQTTAKSSGGGPPKETRVGPVGAEILGLTNGESYSFTLRASYAGATSEPGQAVECTPLAVPKNLAIRTVRDTLELSWDGGGDKGFTIHYRIGDTLKDTAGTSRASGGPPYRFTTLRDSVRYAFAVQGSQGIWRTALSASVSGVFTTGIKVLDNPWHAPNLSASGLALTAGGVPVVLYSDSSQRAALTVATRENGSWVPVGPPGIRKPARQARILLGPEDSPHVLFRNSETSKLELVRLHAGAWESAGLLEFLDNEDFGYARCPSSDFAIGTDGTLYAAIADAARLNHLTVLKRGAAEWEVMDRRGFSAGAASQIRMAVGADGAPVVAFLDAGNENAPVVKKFDGTRFVNLGNPAIAGSLGGIDLIVTGAGEAVLGYLRGSASAPDAAVMAYRGGAWTRLGAEAIGPASELSLASGPDDRIHIATSSGYVYRFDGAGWPSVGPAQTFPAGAVRNVKVAVDGKGVPYVCHQQAGLANNVILRAFDY